MRLQACLEARTGVLSLLTQLSELVIAFLVKIRPKLFLHFLECAALLVQELRLALLSSL